MAPHHPHTWLRHLVKLAQDPTLHTIFPNGLRLCPQRPGPAWAADGTIVPYLARHLRCYRSDQIARPQIGDVPSALRAALEGWKNLAEDVLPPHPQEDGPFGMGAAGIAGGQRRYGRVESHAAAAQLALPLVDDHPGPYGRSGFLRR